MAMKRPANPAFRNLSPGIYPVITESFCRNGSAAKTLDAALKGGAAIVQLREKHKSKRDKLEMARYFRAATSRYGALLVINDDIDIALAVGADGVHLGQSDMACADAREMAPEIVIGVSTHDIGEALKAQEDGADYVNIGPIFATKTKENLVAPLGLDTLRAIATRIGIPFTVMGGIKARHIEELLSVGVKHVAMVTEITQASDVEATTRALQKAMEHVAQRDRP